MANSEIRWIPLGEFIEPYNVRCGNPDAIVSGVNINKEFMRSHANLETTDISAYYSVPPKYFASNLMHIGRDERIPIAYNDTNKEIVVTSAYSVFRVKENKHQEILEEYLFLFFNSKEIDRLAWFYTDGSVRGNLQEKRLFGMQIPVPFVSGKPSIARQKEVVETWRCFKRMKRQNEDLTEPLFQLCRSYIESLKAKVTPSAIGEYIETVDVRNSSGDDLPVMGINKDKSFMPTVANLETVDTQKYKIVSKGQFAFSGMQTGRDECIRIALHAEDTDLLISPAYTVFQIKKDKKDKLLPEFLLLFFKRTEIDRLGWFLSDSSVRSNLDWPRFCSILLPIPDIDTQRAIVNIYHCAEECRRIAAEADALSQTISPALMQHVIHEHN